MGEFLNNIKTKLVTFFNSLNKTQKILLIGGVIALVLAIILVIFFTTRVEYAVLAKNVSPSVAGEMTAELDKQGIPHKEEDNGANLNISVPKNSLSKAKMSLAVGNLLGAEKDFTWTDALQASSSITVSQEEKTRIYLQYQASALESAIKSLSDVEEAKVFLYVPNDPKFVLNTESEYESKASVVLKTKNGVELTKDQVNGIVMILVTSVKGLEKTGVSVVNSQGIELTQSNMSDEDLMGANSLMELKETTEIKLKQKLTEFLENIYGKENVKVMPSVTLDAEDQETTSVEFATPIEGDTTGLIRSVNEVTKNVANGSPAGGVAGTGSNTGNTAANQGNNTDATTTYPTEGGTGSTIADASKTLNYELNQINKSITKKKGQIKQISISVLINNEVLVNKTLTDEAKEEVINLITTAAGVETKSVQVMAQAFVKPNLTEIGSGDKTGIPIILIVIGVLTLLAVGVGVFMFLKAQKKKREEEEKKRLEEEAIKEKERDEILLAQDTNSPKYQIDKFIDTNPEIVAQLLRNWINED